MGITNLQRKNMEKYLRFVSLRAHQDRPGSSFVLGLWVARTLKLDLRALKEIDSIEGSLSVGPVDCRNWKSLDQDYSYARSNRFVVLNDRSLVYSGFRHCCAPRILRKRCEAPKKMDPIRGPTF